MSIVIETTTALANIMIAAERAVKLLSIEDLDVNGPAVVGAIDLLRATAADAREALGTEKPTFDQYGEIVWP